jgi:hypothetical protein
MQLRSALFLSLALALTASAGCEKSSSSGGATASGNLSTEEKDLLSHLPKGGVAVLGGNTFEFQKWMETSPLAKMSAQVSSPEMTAWNTCLGKEKLTMAGTVSLVNDAPVARFYIKGVDLATIEKCAQSSGITGTKDADGKAYTVEIKSPAGVTVQAPYLSVDGGVYTQLQLGGLGAAMSGGGQVTAATRADLEKDVASLAQGTAATDDRFAAMLTKVDRKKTLWFVGNAEGTKIGDKVGLIYGGFSIVGGLGINITAQLKDPKDVEEILKKFNEAKGSLDKMPPQMKALKDAFGKVSLGKADGGLRVSLALSDAELGEITKALAPMLGGLGGMH